MTQSWWRSPGDHHHFKKAFRVFCALISSRFAAPMANGDLRNCPSDSEGTVSFFTVFLFTGHGAEIKPGQ